MRLGLRRASEEIAANPGRVELVRRRCRRIHVVARAAVAVLGYGTASAATIDWRCMGRVASRSARSIPGSTGAYLDDLKGAGRPACSAVGVRTHLCFTGGPALARTCIDLLAALHRGGAGHTPSALLAVALGHLGPEDGAGEKRVRATVTYAAYEAPPRGRSSPRLAKARRVRISCRRQQRLCQRLPTMEFDALRSWRAPCRAAVRAVSTSPATQTQAATSSIPTNHPSCRTWWGALRGGGKKTVPGRGGTMIERARTPGHTALRKLLAELASRARNRRRRMSQEAWDSIDERTTPAPWATCQRGLPGITCWPAAVVPGQGRGAGKTRRPTANLLDVYSQRH